MTIKILSKALIIFSFPLVSLGQDTLTYKQAQDIEEAKRFKNGQQFKTFILKDSSILNIGDTLIVGNISSNATTTSNTLGTTITENMYRTIWAGTFSDNVMTGPQYLREGSKGQKFIIQDIKVRHIALSKKSQVAVYATCKREGDKKNLFTFSLDYGIDVGEVINPKGKMTKSAALSKLKEAKELLDLGLIKKEEYDSLKQKLSPIILNQ